MDKEALVVVGTGPGSQQVAAVGLLLAFLDLGHSAGA
jgi:hypothetical protein